MQNIGSLIFSLSIGGVTAGSLFFAIFLLAIVFVCECICIFFLVRCLLRGNKEKIRLDFEKEEDEFKENNYAIVALVTGGSILTTSYKVLLLFAILVAVAAVIIACIVIIAKANHVNFAVLEVWNRQLENAKRRRKQRKAEEENRKKVEAARVEAARREAIAAKKAAIDANEDAKRKLEEAKDISKNNSNAVAVQNGDQGMVVIEKHTVETVREVVHDNTTNEIIASGIQELLRLSKEKRLQSEISVNGNHEGDEEEEDVALTQQEIDDVEAEDDNYDGDSEINADRIASNERVIGFDEETGCSIVAHYRKSYEARLIQANAKVKNSYSNLKNALLSYEGIKSKILWSGEIFTLDKRTIAKMNVKSNSLELFLALNPYELEDTPYKGADVSGKHKYVDTPFLYRINNARRYTLALELIIRTAEELGLVPIDITLVDYTEQYPFESIDSLVEKGLIHEYIREEKPKATFELANDQDVSSTSNKTSFKKANEDSPKVEQLSIFMDDETLMNEDKNKSIDTPENDDAFERILRETADALATPNNIKTERSIDSKSQVFKNGELISVTHVSDEQIEGVEVEELPESQTGTMDESRQLEQGNLDSQEEPSVFDIQNNENEESVKEESSVFDVSYDDEVVEEEINEQNEQDEETEENEVEESVFEKYKGKEIESVDNDDLPWKTDDEGEEQSAFDVFNHEEDAQTSNDDEVKEETEFFEENKNEPEETHIDTIEEPIENTIAEPQEQKAEQIEEQTKEQEEEKTEELSNEQTIEPQEEIKTENKKVEKEDLGFGEDFQLEPAPYRPSFYRNRNFYATDEEKFAPPHLDKPLEIRKPKPVEENIEEEDVFEQVEKELEQTSTHGINLEEQEEQVGQEEVKEEDHNEVVEEKETIEETPKPREIPSIAPVQAKETATINIIEVEQYYKENETVSLATLKAKKLISQTADRLKVDATQDCILTKKLKVEANKFSMDAIKAIGSADGDSVMIR